MLLLKITFPLCVLLLLSVAAMLLTPKLETGLSDGTMNTASVNCYVERG